jgi:hypothetical protein
MQQPSGVKTRRATTSVECVQELSDAGCCPLTLNPDDATTLSAGMTSPWLYTSLSLSPPRLGRSYLTAAAAAAARWQ